MLARMLARVNYLLYCSGNLQKYLTFQRLSQYTMVPSAAFIENLKLAEKVATIQGCVVECGVWRGGQIAGIASVLGKHRRYYLFDSFEGLPPATDKDGEAAINWQRDSESPGFHDNCTATEDWAAKAMHIAGCTDFQLVKGWFSSTVPNFDFPEPIALLRLDGDWYDSTMVCLSHLFPRVLPGGMIIIDDYHAWDGCSKALHDYLSAHDRSERILQFNNSVCYLIKRG